MNELAIPGTVLQKSSATHVEENQVKGMRGGGPGKTYI